MTRYSKLASAAACLSGVLLAFPSIGGATVSQPMEIINRPRTLPGGQLELHGGVDLSHASYNDPTTGASRSSNSLFAPLGLGYGISDDFEVRVFYGLALHPTFTGRTPLDVRLSYTFFRSEKLSAAAQVRSGVDLGSNDVTPLRVGVNALYKLTGTLAVFTPGEQLRIGLAGTGNRPVSLDLPVGVGLQFTPQVFGSLTTNLAHIGIANDGDAVIFGDMLPISLAAFYSFSNRADVGAHLDIDLKNTDYVTVGVLARLFL